MTRDELNSLGDNITPEESTEAVELATAILGYEPDSEISALVFFCLKAARMQAVEDTTSQGKRIVANAPIEYSVYAPSILNSRITITDK